MDEVENVRPEIPGLVETEKTKKGKKRANAAAKKTLSLQNFLQDSNNQDSNGQATSTDYSSDAVIESHFAKLNLDDEVKFSDQIQLNSSRSL